MKDAHQIEFGSVRTREEVIESLAAFIEAIEDGRDEWYEDEETV